MTRTSAHHLKNGFFSRTVSPMPLVEIRWQPESRFLRQFAVALMVFGGLAGGWHLVRGGGWPGAAVVWGLCGLLGIMGCLAPRALRPVYLAWMLLLYPAVWILSLAVLAGVYYLAVVPTGLVMKLLGRDPLRRRLDRNAKSYWEPESDSPPLERYFRQF